MSLPDIMNSAMPFLAGMGSSIVFVLVIFIGFCVALGFTKTKVTAGRGLVIKSLDEGLNHQAVHYFSPTDPRGPADQLKSPELVEAAARK